MSRGQNPLVLMMALSLPSTASALGLGDIHVDSALNEPLAAEIDIVGASAEDLLGLTAAVANKETFTHLNADRPSFLQSTTFKVAQNSRGRPVLAIRSTESFSEPLVDLVVDLRWHNGELIRQYSLLLDPAGFPSAVKLATPVRAPIVQPTASLPVAAASSPAAIAPAAAPPRKLTQVKVGAKATLRGVAWRVGARSEADLQTLMYAIFHANPSAFDGNINRLHRGALLNIPSAEDVAGLSKTAASREVHAQMAAWRGDSRAMRAASVESQPASTPSNAPAPASPAPAAVAAAPLAAAPVAAPPIAAPALDAAATAALNHRMQSLEKNLSDMQALFDREHDRMLDLQAQLTYAQNNKPVLGVVQASPVGRQRSLADLIAAGLVLAGAFSAYFYWQRRRKAARLAAPEGSIEPTVAPLDETAALASAAIAAQESKASPPTDAAGADKTDVVPSLAARILDDIDIASLESSYLEEALENSSRDQLLVDTAVLERNDLDEDVNLENSLIDDTFNLHADSSPLHSATTVMATTPGAQAPADEAIAPLDSTKLDYDLLDLDLTAQHVHMPSGLNEPVVVKELRTSLVDVLKMAIDREPDRRDLRMKLIETYYAAAAANRQGFLDAVQKFSSEGDFLADDEWGKIAHMGRQIAGDTELFAAEAGDKDDLADCA